MNSDNPRLAAVKEALRQHAPNAAHDEKRLEDHAVWIVAGFGLALAEQQPSRRPTGSKTAEQQLMALQKHSAAALHALKALKEPAYHAFLRAEPVEPDQEPEGGLYVEKMAETLNALSDVAARAMTDIEAPSQPRRRPPNAVATVVADFVFKALQDLTGETPTRTIKKTDAGRKDGKLIHTPAGDFVTCLGAVFDALGVETGPDAPARAAIAAHKSEKNSE